MSDFDYVVPPTRFISFNIDGELVRMPLYELSRRVRSLNSEREKIEFPEILQAAFVSLGFPQMSEEAAVFVWNSIAEAETADAEERKKKLALTRESPTGTG